MPEELEQTVAHLIEKLERRFYGKFRGLVVDNVDPEQLGRLKVSVPSVLGTEVVTGWAAACTPYGGEVGQGFLSIPEIGSGVWVEFEEGDLALPIWVGTYWSKPDGDSELPRPNDLEGAEEGEVQDPISRKIIKTLKGHTIQLEDKDDEELVLIVQMSGDDKRNVVKMNADGITILQKIDGETSNTVEMTESGIKLMDFTENSIDMNDSAFNITSKVALTIDASGQAIEIKADTVDINQS